MPASGLYQGSLSAQGNMVAMALNGVNLKANTTIGDFDPTYYQATGEDLDAGTKANLNAMIVTPPYLLGNFRQYYRDPTTCTFGNTSAIPAITGVMPASVSIQGNFVYYVDLAICRATAPVSVTATPTTSSTTFDIKYFINIFNQAIGWTLNSNSYLLGLKNSENRNFEYYGETDYESLVTQGFNEYQQGQALTRAFENLGIMTDSISSGQFGTVNAVAQTLINNGLGGVGNLKINLISQGVNLNDLLNPIYTVPIQSVLGNITNPTDLAVIQTVIQSNIPNMRSPVDYTSISALSGLPNDSAFATMANVGQDLYTKTAYLSVTNGNAVAYLIKNTQNESNASVESLAGTNSLLNSNVVASLRSYLPISSNNDVISVVNVIGSISGYYTDQLKLVNDGLEQLRATSYGPLIRDALTKISRVFARVGPNGETYTDPEGPADPGNTNANYWTSQLNSAITEYNTLLSTIVTDTTGNIPRIVSQINDNYLSVCQQVALEIQNYDKAKFNTSNFGDTSTILGFVSGLPYYGADPDNLATDLMIYSMAQNNDAGNTVKTIMAQAKNNQLLGQAGIRLRGEV